MTIITAVRDGACIIMGSDSMASARDELAWTLPAGVKMWETTVQVVEDDCDMTDDDDDSEANATVPAVLETVPLLLGFATSVFVIQFVHFAFTWPPKPRSMDWMQWLVAVAMPALQKKIMKRFFTNKPIGPTQADPEYVTFNALLAVKEAGCKGRIFAVYDCCDVREEADFACIGCAQQEVRAAYTALTTDTLFVPSPDRLRPMAPDELLVAVMNAAAEVRCDIRGPMRLQALA
jgi:hypothetical protein